MEKMDRNRHERRIYGYSKGRAATNMQHETDMQRLMQKPTRRDRHKAKTRSEQHIENDMQLSRLNCL